MKILQFNAENVKRLTVVEITPEGHLVQITGANAQGKTSVLDAIWMALGGADAVPDKPIRKGAKAARIEVKLGDSDGVRFIVTRTFTEKGTYLKVTGADGAKYSSPDKMMKELMGAIGFDPLSFMHMKGKDQFEMLRKVVKLDVDLDALDRQRATLFEDRTGINRDLASAEARAGAIVVPDDLPETEPDLDALTQKLADAAGHNSRVANARRIVEDAHADFAQHKEDLAELEARVAAARDALAAEERQLSHLEKDEIPAEIDTAQVTQEISAARVVAEGFRKQAAKIAATTEVETYKRRADEKTTAIKEIDDKKKAALTAAKMPIEGLSFDDGTVTFNGLPLAQASASQQLRVSAAIGAALNPKLRVILARDGSLLDSKALTALAEFAKEQDMQIFLERVDESGEVGIVMEDGHVKGQEELVAAHEKAEAEGANTPAVEGAGAGDAGGEAETRARTYLTAMVKALPGHLTPEAAEAANAQVKVKLARFPAMISAEWVPEYLAVMKRLTAKKALMLAPTCPYCTKPSELVDGTAIYPHRPDLAAKQFWRCPGCSVCVARVPKFPGYMATSDGVIWSCWNNRWGMSKASRALKASPGKRDKYYTLHLSKKKKAYTFTVHTVILVSFVGRRPAGMEGCHGDRDLKNNALENLRWDTSAGNKADTIRHGTVARGEKQKSAKLTDAKVRTIKKLASEGVTRKSLAAKFGLHKRNIYRVLSGETWRHVV